MALASVREPSAAAFIETRTGSDAQRGERFRFARRKRACTGPQSVLSKFVRSRRLLGGMRDGSFLGESSTLSQASIARCSVDAGVGRRDPAFSALRWERTRAFKWGDASVSFLGSFPAAAHHRLAPG